MHSDMCHHGEYARNLASNGFTLMLGKFHCIVCCVLRPCRRSLLLVTQKALVPNAMMVSLGVAGMQS